MILDFGCGYNKKKGTLGVDENINSSADIIHNLNFFPYPFKSRSVSKIYITDTFFLLDNPIKVMVEFHRILKKSGQLIITNPYFRSKFAFIDPFTKTFYTVHSFDFYDPSKQSYKNYKYTSLNFTINSIKFNENINNNCLAKFLIFFANKNPYFYEKISHIFPLDRITYYLVKN